MGMHGNTWKCMEIHDLHIFVRVLNVWICILGVWTCLWVPGPGTGPGPGPGPGLVYKIYIVI